MNALQIIFGIYALLMFAGGLMGYKKAGSKMSLYMGIVSSVVILIGLCILSSNPYLGQMIITAMCVLLTITFLIRLIKTKKIMPSGMLFIISACAAGLSIYQMFVN